jgi:hypothetical protein
MSNVFFKNKNSTKEIFQIDTSQNQVKMQISAEIKNESFMKFQNFT